MKNIIIAILVAVILILGFLFFTQKKSNVSYEPWPETEPATVKSVTNNSPVQNNTAPVSSAPTQTNPITPTQPTQTQAVSSNCKPNDPPSIRLISPNGGETFVAGQQITIKWISCNNPYDPKQVAVRLAGDNGYTHYLSSATNSFTVPDNGSLIANLPPPNHVSINSGSPINFQIGKHYKIIVGISPQEYDSYDDSSDSNFTINSPAAYNEPPCTTPSITDFLATDSDFMIPAKCLSKLEIWYVPSGTGVTSDMYQKVATATNYQGPLSSQIFMIKKVCPPPSAAAIFARGYDQYGNQLSSDKYSQYSGVTNIWNVIFDPYCS